MAPPRIIVRQPTLEYPIAAAGKAQKCTTASLPQHIFHAWDALLDDFGSSSSHHGSVHDVLDVLFQYGHLHATACLLVAVVLNHVRRVLLPWLGTFFAHHAVADMKLARSSPHHFVEQSLDFTWQWLLLWTALTYVTHAATAEPLTEWASRRESPRRMSAAASVLWVLAALSWAEYAYVHCCWTAAQLYAHGTLMLWGGEEEQALLQKLMEKEPGRAAVQIALVISGLHHWVLPVVTNILCRGRWIAVGVYACVAGVTVQLIRYSNYYFIVLAVSDMLVTFGWFGLVSVVVGMEILREKMGLTADVAEGGRKTTLRNATRPTRSRSLRGRGGPVGLKRSTI